MPETKTGGEDRLVRAARNAVKQVEEELARMIATAGPREGTITIEVLGTRGQVRVKPTPFYVFSGDRD